MAHTHEGRIPDLSRNQSLVIRALVEAKGPLSAYEILDRVRPEGIRAPLQVYRALDSLIQLGMAHRLESLNRFVACAEDDHHDHELIAFAICNTCGNVDEFSDHELDERLGSWAGQHAFKSERITLEIRGICKACTAASAS